jgi:hypothetical protein
MLGLQRQQVVLERGGDFAEENLVKEWYARVQ